MVAGVVRDPDRNVPRATIGGIVLAGVVYLFSSVLMMGIVPAEQLATSGAPFALVAGEMFGPWAIPVIALAAGLKATGTLGGWMQVSGESGARAAHRGFLPAIFGRMRANGSAAWGLFIVCLAMTAIAALTLTPDVASQFEVIVNMVVTLIVMADIAAGLSLLLGTPAKPSGRREKLLGLAALVACGLLVVSAPVKILIGSLVVAALVWVAWRAFASHPPAQR
jgi:arginine:agmatine antiporter